MGPKFSVALVWELSSHHYHCIGEIKGRGFEAFRDKNRGMERIGAFHPWHDIAFALYVWVLGTGILNHRISASFQICSSLLRIGHGAGAGHGRRNQPPGLSLSVQRPCKWLSRAC